MNLHCFFKKITFFLALVSLCLTAILSSGCGSSRRGFESTNSSTTGHKKTIEDADTKELVETDYTISGFEGAYNQLQNKVGQNTDLNLAASVQDVSVTIVSESQMKVQFQFAAPFDKNNLDFNLALKNKGAVRTGHAQQNNFNLSVTCLNKSCDLIELILTLPNTKQVGLLNSNTQPRLKMARAPSLKSYSDLGLKTLEAYYQKSAIRQKSIVVVHGPAFSDITVSSSAIGSRPLLHLKTELLKTQNVVVALKEAELFNSPDVKAKLIGNDASSGDLLFELVSSREVAILAFETESSPNQNENFKIGERDLRRRAQPLTGLFPTSPTNSVGLNTANDFASYGLHKKTQEMIRFLTQKDQKGVQNVFAYSHNVSPYISSVFEKQKMTPELAYLLPVESAYLKGGAFNAQQVTGAPVSAENQNPSAYGPWQIVNRTAFAIRDLSGLPFNIIFIRNKKPDPNDDRGFLIQSTYMASIYLKKLQSLFPQDGGMAVMAYHAGEFGVCKEVAEGCTARNMNERLRHLAHRNVSLSQVEKYDMIGKIHRNYAFQFLAWRELGQNPKPYNLHNIQKIKSDGYKARLSRAEGPQPIDLTTKRIN